MSSEEWHINRPSIYYLESSRLNPYYTMALDEYFSRLIEEGSLPGMLRLYNWEPCSISVGYFFKTPLFDLDNLKREGVRLVRRVTGGSAIYHKEDLTYSLIIPKGCYGINDRREYYLFIASILSSALKGLGIEALIKDVTEVKGGTPDCFNSVSQYEITDSRGSKLIGSAQKIYKNSLLQHGSLFYAYDPEEIGRYFKFSQRGSKRWNAYELDYPLVVNSFRRAFSELFELKEYRLTADDELQLDKLVEERYSLEKWNFAR